MNDVKFSKYNICSVSSLSLMRLLSAGPGPSAATGRCIREQHAVPTLLLEEIQGRETFMVSQVTISDWKCSLRQVVSSHTTENSFPEQLIEPLFYSILHPSSFSLDLCELCWN